MTTKRTLAEMEAIKGVDFMEKFNAQEWEKVEDWFSENCPEYQEWEKTWHSNTESLTLIKGAEMYLYSTEWEQKDIAERWEKEHGAAWRARQAEITPIGF